MESRELILTKAQKASLWRTQWLAGPAEASSEEEQIAFNSPLSGWPLTDFFVFLKAVAKEILKFHSKTKKTIF